MYWLLALGANCETYGEDCGKGGHWGAYIALAAFFLVLWVAYQIGRDSR